MLHRMRQTCFATLLMSSACRADRRDYAATPLGELVNRLQKIIQDRFIQTVADQTGRTIKAILLPRPLKGIVGPTLFQRLIQQIRPGDTIATACVADTRAVTQPLGTIGDRAGRKRRARFPISGWPGIPRFS